MRLPLLCQGAQEGTRLKDEDRRSNTWKYRQMQREKYEGTQGTHKRHRETYGDVEVTQWVQHFSSSTSRFEDS